MECGAQSVRLGSAGVAPQHRKRLGMEQPAVSGVYMAPRDVQYTVLCIAMSVGSVYTPAVVLNEAHHRRHHRIAQDLIFLCL